MRTAAVTAFSLFIALSGFGKAIPTRIVVRVVAHDGKIVGKDAGGARVRIYDAATHRLLAHGIQNGESGNTEQIMETKYARGDTAKFASASAASFTTTLALSRPARLEIVAEGPLAFPASKQRVTRTVWVLPGASMDPATQDGIVLELYGFAMKFDDVTPGSGTVAVTAHVAMMCGCPIAKDGPWPESRFTVTASLRRSGSAGAEERMTWTAKNTFEGSFNGLASGQYELVVTASDVDRANFSSIRRTVAVR